MMIGADGAVTVLFFKCQAPIEPTAFVDRICKDAAAGVVSKTTRHVNRLTPITLIGKATMKSIEEVARVVVAPHFHAEGGGVKKVRCASRSSLKMKSA